MKTDIYQGKKILVTGHSGFKGSWLSLWLSNLGADVIGYSLAPNTDPNHFELLKLDIKSHYENVCDLTTLKNVIKEDKPEMIFHLAAQPLVRYSYNNPIETYLTNVMGTINVLEASRYSASVKAIVVVTTDKCYENLEQRKGYIESDRMGGYDPYSSSKGCAEIAVSSYRNSFFNLNAYGESHQILLASARAGNVIGGGDWSEDRLIPDLIKAAIADKKTTIRYPHATRPWQHVIEPLHGYLKLGEKLLLGQKEYAEAWNFGPEENDVLSVGEVLTRANQYWDKIKFEFDNKSDHFHEAGLLSLNINKAKSKLGWIPRWGNELTIQKTIEWYRAFYEKDTILTENHLKAYIETL